MNTSEMWATHRHQQLRMIVFCVSQLGAIPQNLPHAVFWFKTLKNDVPPPSHRSVNSTALPVQHLCRARPADDTILD